ncbi:MAG: FkbM family methyltransferase [Candidatus Marinamargulisbacteria bacterium]|jgi:FkbM family methyltransferase
MIKALKNKLKDTYYHMYPRESDPFIKLVKQKFDPLAVKTVFDIGSRDGEQSLELAAAFPNAKVFAFECNPDTLKYCYAKEKINPRVTIVPKAVSDKDGTLTFYQNDIEKFDFEIPRSYRGGREDIYVAGASSLYHSDHSLVQKQKIEVESIRLDTFCNAQGIETVDIIWMDLEGAELRALQSLGNRIKNTKMIWTETRTSPGSAGQCSFSELNAYLKPFSFDYLHRKRVDGNVGDDQGQTDVPYINTRLFDLESR